MKFTTKEVNVNMLLSNRNWRRDEAGTAQIFHIETWYGKDNPEDLIRVRAISPELLESKGEDFANYFEVIAGHCRLAKLIELEETNILVRVYSELTEADEQKLLIDKPSLGLKKCEIYKQLWLLLNGDRTLEAWLKAINTIGVGSITLLAAPKSGKLELTSAEKKKVVALRGNGKGWSLIECQLRTFLRMRWTGMKQSIDMLSGVSEEVASLFAYGLHSRQKGFLQNLPASAVVAGYNDKGTFSFTTDFNNADLLHLAKVGKEDFANSFEGEMYTHPVKPELEGKIDMGEVLDYCEKVNAGEAMEYFTNEKLLDDVLSNLASTADGRAMLDEYLEAVN